MSDLTCLTDARRREVRKHPGWNGLDFVEVDEAQTELTAYFLGRAPERLQERHFRLEGGRTERDRVKILDIEVLRAQQSHLDDKVLIHVDKPGDHSTYTLRLVGLDHI